MHPDAIIAGLRRELDRLDRNADDYAQRKATIEAEIKLTDKLDRPEVTPEQPETVVDQNVLYLAGLKRELERVADEFKDDVRVEIRRVEKLIHKEADVDDKPSEQEIEQRKQARAGRKVERAVNPPGGREAPVTAPAEGEKEQSS